MDLQEVLFYYKLLYKQIEDRKIALAGLPMVSKPWLVPSVDSAYRYTLSGKPLATIYRLGGKWWYGSAQVGLDYKRTWSILQPDLPADARLTDVMKQVDDKLRQQKVYLWEDHPEIALLFS